MTRRTVTLHSITVNRAYARTDYVLDNIEGEDALQRFEDLANTITEDAMKEDEKQWWCLVSNVTRLNRACLVELESGTYGEDRRVIDTQLGTESGRLKKHHSAMTKTRVLCVIPPGSTLGVLAIERYGNEGGGAKLRTKFQEDLVDIGPVTDDKGTERAIVAKFPAVTSGEAWLATARLRRVEAVRLRSSLDVGDGTTPRELPVQYSEVFEPIHGEGSLPSALFAAIRGQNLVQAADYLQVDDPEEVDEVLLTAVGDEGQKTFALGRESTPGVRIVVKNHNETSPTDARFIGLIEDEIGKFFKSITGKPWDGRWVR